MAAELVSTSVNPVAPATLKPRAYVMLLAGNGDYVKGGVGLAKGLRKVKSVYLLVVAVLPDVPVEHQQILKDQGCDVQAIELVYPLENQSHFAPVNYIRNYSKLRIWEFVKYSKMVYLDGDMQVCDNIDHLFDKEDGYFHVVMDCFCDRTWRHTPQYEIGYCQQCPDKVQWPDEMGPSPSPYFNDGMFVFEPNLTTYNNLLCTLKTTSPTPFAQQDFLNRYFRNIYVPLPLAYNLDITMLWRHPENAELEKVKVIHYCEAGSKPWRYAGQEDTDTMQREDIKMLVKKMWDLMLKEDIRMLVQKWWDIYRDESLDYKNWVWRPRARTRRSTRRLDPGPSKR